MSGERPGAGPGAGFGARAAGRLEDVPVAIALVAEAAWIAVFAGLLQAFALRDPLTGIGELLLAATAGTAAARTLPDRVGEAWSRVALGLAVAAGLVGWLAPAEVRALLLAPMAAGGDGGGTVGIGPALAANPGGWLAAVAFVRGIAHARRPLDTGRVGTMLFLAVPAIALAAIVGGMISEPSRGQFLAAAQVQVLVFLAASVLALALARMAGLGRGASVDWRRNPAWLVLTGTLVAGTGAVAAVASVTIGHPVATFLTVMFVPLLAIGFIAGFDRRTPRILAVCFAIAGTLAALGRLLAARQSTATQGGGDTPAPVVPPATVDPVTAAGMWVLVMAVGLGALAVLVLARLWLRRGRRPLEAEDEVRVIDRDARDAQPRPRRRWGLRRRTRPADAVAAYRALLEDLEGRRPVAREPGETPVEHARRLRRAGHGTLALELLAADYGLARFGGVALSAAETRRAIGRSDRLRGALPRVPVEAGELDAASGQTVRRTGEATVGERGSRRGGGPGADLPDADEPGETGSILNRIRRGP
jgi:hypothetical protein